MENMKIERYADNCNSNEAGSGYTFWVERDGGIE